MVEQITITAQENIIGNKGRLRFARRRKEHFVYFDAQVKVNRGALPGQRYKMK